MALQSITQLANITLQDSTPTIVFSRIPQNYRDLIINITGTSPFNGQIRAYANTDNNSNYPYVMMYAYNTTAGSGSNTTNGFRLQWVVVGEYYTTTAELYDYSISNKHTNCISRYSSPTETGLLVSKWNDSTPINTLTFFHEGGNLNAGTTISLYGRIA